MASIWRYSIYFGLFSIVVYAIRQFNAGPGCQSNASLDGKVVIVTGANTGIGKETALDLAQRGGHVVMACRSLPRCEQAAADIRSEEGVAADSVEVMLLDLASLSSVREFVDNFKEGNRGLDVLINNAGLIPPPERQLTEDGFELTFGVNHLGHFLLTHLLLDTLKASAPSRVVTVSSMAHEDASMNFSDLMGEESYQYWNAYAQSKLANVLFSKELANRLKGTGVTTYSLHPGVIFTEIIRNMPIAHIPILGELLPKVGSLFLKNSVDGAQTTICCAVDERLTAETGKYYSDCADVATSKDGDDDEDARRLWEISEKLLGLK